MRTKTLNASFVVVLLAAATLTPTSAAAYEPSPVDYSRKDWAAGASRKLGRGLSNAGLGWIEIFKGMEDVREESGLWAGASWGPFYGTVNALRRTAVGVYETATFPFGGANRYDPILEPEFVLSDQN
jgi:putative exosortase-associated protein (TIGR04073 family)